LKIQTSLIKDIESGDEWITRYEELRICALGQKTRAAGMILFLQQGMSNWMRHLECVDLHRYRTSQYTTRMPVGSGVAVLIADAVLEIAGPIFL